MIAISIVLAVVLLAVIFLIYMGRAAVNIGGQEVGIRERRYWGRPLPAARVVAMSGEIGFQARVLQPGLTFQVPFLYRVTKAPMLVINEDEVGIIESIDGAPLESGRIF